MTNQEKFIQIFGIYAWQHMIVFSGIAEQFKEYWTSPYKESEGRGMTRNAIEHFKFLRKIFCEEHLKICPKDSIAYQATLKEKEFYDTAIKALEQEPCEDCISRQAVIDMTGLSEWFDSSDSYNDFVIALSDLPPVTPQPKTGHWIHNKCDKCGASRPPLFDNFCPNCGTRMVESEDKG